MKLSLKEFMRYAILEEYDDILGYESIVEAGINTKWKNYIKEFGEIDNDSCLDDYREMLQMFRYRMQLMLICCLCELWEQDLYQFLKDNKLISTSENNSYNIIKQKYFEEFNYSIDKNSIIIEMRKVVNAIKHGKGDSLNYIIGKCGDNILADSSLGESYNGIDKPKMIKQIEFDENTLTSKTLNLNGELKTYHDAIMEFWKNIFKRMDENE